MRRVIPVADYIGGVESEFRQRGFRNASLQLDTVYLGGGTPSLLGASGVRALLDRIRTFAEITDGAEVTLEANPEDVSDESVRVWRDAGINRLSIGMQSFDDSVLRWMHRVHNASQSERAVKVARDAGIQSLSLDLIFALPTALNRDWSRDLACAAALEPDHISLYGLTVEPFTAVGKWTAAGTVVEAPEERYSEQFLAAHNFFSGVGYEHYEVSNFAKSGQRAMHNSAYWNGAPYLGVGPSAHGFDGRVRRWNVAPYTGWLNALGDCVDPVAGSEQLSPAERVTEAVYLGLRTLDGLLVTEFDKPLVSKWVSAGWLELTHERDSARARCTPEGWLRLDRLAADLTALRSD